MDVFDVPCGHIYSRVFGDRIATCPRTRFVVWRTDSIKVIWNELNFSRKRCKLWTYIVLDRAVLDRMAGSFPISCSISLRLRRTGIFLRFFRPDLMLSDW